MAMIKCTECNGSISSSAKTCPHCGKKRQSGRFTNVLFGVAVVIGVIMLLSVIGDFLPSDPLAKNTNTKTAPVKMVQCEISFTDTDLTITNNKETDLSGKPLTIYINGHISQGYSITITGPQKNSSAKIPLYKFTKKDGTRFNPYNTALTRAYVHCPGYKEVCYSAQ